jgi:hypothetical protein
VKNDTLLHAFIIANLLTEDGYLISLIMIVVIVAHFKTEYKCNTIKCRHKQVLLIAMVI